MSQLVRESNPLGKVILEEVLPSSPLSMSKKDYKWKRFWCPRTGNINLADGGYLYDPDAEWGKTYNPDLVSLEAIAEIPCLVLLGEPGIGKSRELEKLRKYTEKIIDEDDQIQSIDLENCSEDKLYTKLFNSQAFIDWINGTHRLYLFLDSLDQGWLTIQRLPTLLVEEFRQLDEISEKKDLKPSILLFLALKTGFLGKDAKIKNRPNLSRLYLRLVCRIFPFSHAEDGFKNLWSSHYRSYCLAPLSESNIKAAFNEDKLDADRCWQEIIDKGLLPLAIKPISLQFLIEKLQRNNGKLPQNQNLIDIYIDGCRELCREPKDETRHPLRPVSSLEVDQRLSIAARIAAVTTFCLRPTIWTRQSFGDYDSDIDVRPEELCGQCENTNNEKGLKVTSRFVQEVLDIQLFSDRDSNRMGWAHQTYAEFLAAWYLTQHETPLAKIKNLIFSSEDPNHKLIPQLHETAAWLASMRLDVLQEIIKTDPDILLKTDVPTDDGVRASIVENLLTQYEEGKLFDRDRSNFRNYRKLKHPGLVEQLRPYICNSSKQLGARDLAIDIIEVCEVHEFQEELLRLALDSNQPVLLRVSATKALGAVGDTDTKLKLMPLALNQLQEDEDDRLKGWVLLALWPTHLTAEELFRVITPPKKSNFLGGYQIFLHTMPSQLQPSDLVTALKWLENQGLRHWGHRYQALGNSILMEAWEHFDWPGVAESFTRICLIQWREYQSIISHNSELQRKLTSSLHTDSKNRRTLVEEAVICIAVTEEEPDFLLSSAVDNIFFSEDVLWMLEKLQSSNCENVQKTWSYFIEKSFDSQDVKQIDTILVAAQSNERLQEVFLKYYEPIQLDSDQAKRLKTDYLRIQEMQNRKQDLSLNSVLQEKISPLLEQLESGDLSAWLLLNEEMALKLDNTYYDDEYLLDITQLPGWQEIDEASRARILEGAKLYIQQQGNVDYNWIGNVLIHQPSAAACRAFQLLLRFNPDFFQVVSSLTWKRWAPIIVATPSDRQHDDLHLEIVKYAYLNAPKESINAFIKAVDGHNHRYGHSYIINCFDKCWDERIEIALIEKVKDSTLKSECFDQILENLFEQGATEAIDFAQSLICQPLSNDEVGCEKSLIAARVLVENADPERWSFLWQFIQQDSLFGREVLELVADRNSRIQLAVTEAQLADLYIWLVRQYPYEGDPDYSNEVLAHVVTPREEMANLRNSILSQLKERGTPQACVEIERLIRELPSITWLRNTLIDAQVNMRRKTWQPMTPEEFLQFAISQDPSNLDLSNQIDVIDQRTKKMEDEPKIENKITISNSPNSPINAPIGTSGVTNSNVNLDSSDTKKGVNWGNWLAVIGILVAIIAIPFSMSVSGAFNEEFKEWFNRIFPSRVEQRPAPKSE